MNVKFFTIMIFSCTILLLLFKNIQAETSESSELVQKNSNDIYEFIVQVQYLYELCVVIVPDKKEQLNNMYANSGISTFDEIMPKKYNRLIKLIDTPKK
ncbi:hypothetical protein [Aliikangiella maris]|uniref:Uncharacterized protein n=2 Tax=Aliikangiella maris TaxID=3162458 RepID=A0ABV2BUE6_9GAMM